MCSAGSGSRLQGLSGAPDAPHSQRMNTDLTQDIPLYKVRPPQPHNGDAYLLKLHIKISYLM